MSQTAGPSSDSTDNTLLRIMVGLQVAILIGLLVVFLQFDGIPERVADVAPQSVDNSGQIFELQASVDALSAKVDALQATLDGQASPTPSSPTP